MAEVAAEPRGGFPGALDSFFKISAKGSSFGTEIFAGISTFLSLSYIFIVNPAILSKAGIDPSISLFATLVISTVATLVMGLWANLPFVVSTGLEMNGFVTFFAVAALGFSWQQALGMVFWSGVLMVVLTVTSLREKIIDAIPTALKVGLSFSVGVFLVLIAGSISGLLHYNGLVLAGFGSPLSPNCLALALGFGLVVLFQRLRIPGAVLLSILVTSGFYQLCQSRQWLGFPSPAPATGPSFSAHMFDGVLKLDPSVILTGKALSVILVLFVLDFFGSVAKFIGLTLNTSILEQGRLPRRTRALLIDGVGTSFAAMLGTTSVVTFVESAVGIGMGGRTGLSAIVCGFLMAACFFAFPLVQYIPVAATTGALVYVGLGLCPRKEQFASFPPIDKVALAAMPLVTIATFAIDKAMLAGFALCVGAGLVFTRRANPYLVASTLLLALGVALQLR